MRTTPLLLILLSCIMSCSKQEICSPENLFQGIYPSFLFCQDSLTQVKYDTIHISTEPCTCWKHAEEMENQYNRLKEIYKNKNNVLLIDAHNDFPARFNCIKS